jgi:hypothetical protein
LDGVAEVVDVGSLAVPVQMNANEVNAPLGVFHPPVLQVVTSRRTLAAERGSSGVPKPPLWRVRTSTNTNSLPSWATIFTSP